MCFFSSGNKLYNNIFIFKTNSDALQRTNATMRQQYSMVNNWHNSVKELKETHSHELNKFRNINDEVKWNFPIKFAENMKSKN